MINIIHGGTDSFNAVVYGEQNPANLDFFKRSIANVGQTLTDIGKQFYSNTSELYERFNGSDAMRLAKAAARAAASLFMPDRIGSIFEMGQFQQAPPVMQRYLMAEPFVRAQYHAQKCDGYSDTYVDREPGLVGDAHYDYRRVMHGVIKDDDESYVKFYIEDLEPGDRHLSHEDKVDIINSWDILKALMKAGGEDPTSPFNSKL